MGEPEKPDRKKREADKKKADKIKKERKEKEEAEELHNEEKEKKEEKEAEKAEKKRLKEKKADQESRPRRFELVSFSNFKLFVFTTCLIAWCTVYQKLMYSIYFSEAWHMFDHFMRIMANQASHHQRSLERNMLFNFMRCFFDEFVTYMVFETLPDK